jgi:Ca2+-binding EF-hand superfamily protein
MSEFLEAFSSEKYDHMRSITASLFNFLDRNQTGSVTFVDLVKKLYPALDEHKYRVIEKWVAQYESMYNS